MKSRGRRRCAGRLLSAALVVTLVIGALSPGIASADPVAVTADDWPSFRGNDDNNAVTNAPTPRNADEAEMYWAVKKGNGWGSGAIGAPIIVGGWLVFCSGKNLFRANRYTGEIDYTTVGVMSKASNYNIVPPTYADGKIFVPLENGTIQAFDAGTLKSLWIYEDEKKGQGNTQIVYHNGYVYTGFWVSETASANFVCVSAKDEDPSRSDEKKTFEWVRESKGGFYWAGAYVCDNFLLVGTDDGEDGYTSQTSALLSLNPTSGAIITSIGGLNADIRSTISHDPATDRYYFGTKGGSFYSLAVNSDGTFPANPDPTNSDYPKDVDLKELPLYQLDFPGSTTKAAMITSTPVIADGRAYVGIGGASQFSKYAGHGIAVIDLASWKLAYTARTMGYPQSSGLLSTAYNSVDGYNYIYFTDNYTPGVVRVIKDRLGAESLIEPMTDVYNSKPFNDIAPILITPARLQAGYCLGSVIADSEGALYLKNDSTHLMAVGSRNMSLSVAVGPAKIVYNEGEVFDPTGMKVYAQLANGRQRDVTSLISYRTAALTTDDEDVTITYENMMYHDRKVPGAANEGGIASDSIETTVGVSVVGAPVENVPDDDSQTVADPNNNDQNATLQNSKGQNSSAAPAGVDTPAVSQAEKAPAKASAPRKLVAAKRSVKVYFKTPPNASAVKKLSVSYRVKGTKKWKTKTFAYKKGLSSVTIKKLKKGKKYEVRLRFGNAKGFGGYGKTKTSGKVK
jgi:hypothetical protein